MLLKGMKVVEFGNFISAPFASKLLADMGADVTKVETGDGDPLREFGPSIDDRRKLSGLFVSLNLAKKLLRLDIRSPLGKSIFLKLVSRSDVLIENYGKSYWEAIGLPWTDIIKEKPGIVIVSLTPFGNEGPYANYKARDINVNALSGIVDCIGYPHKKPINLPFHQSFHQQGLNGAAVSIFALLHAMVKKDEPVIADISASDIMASYVSTHNLIYSTRNIFMKREGKRAAGSAGAYPFTILRGKESPIAIMCPAVGEFKILTEAMGSPEWSRDPKYQNPSEISRHYADEVDAHIEAWLSQLSDEDIEKISLKYGIPLYPVRNIDKIIEDDQYNYRKFFRNIRYGGRSYSMPGLPFSCIDEDGPDGKESERDAEAGHVADLSVGKDSDQLLRGLGYADGQIDEFRRHDVI